MNNKIIVFHLDDSKNLRGGERQVLYLIEELNKLGVENYIVLRKNSPLYLKCLELKIPFMTLPYIFEWDILSAVILAFKIKKINLNRKKVILHTHTAHTCAIALLARFFISAKIVVHRRVDFEIKNNFFSKVKYLKADAIIAISEAVKNVIKKTLPEHNIFVVPSSIPLSFIKNLASNRIFPRQNITVGFLGAFVPHKDPLNLIKAAYECIKKKKDIIFLMGGDGKLKKEAEDLIKKLELEKNVKLVGYIDDNINFLKSIDIFVLPSKEEGLGSVLIEAMAAELPLVGTDAGGIPELIEDNFNGYVVEKQNPQKLADAILKIASEKEIYEKFSKNSYEKVKNYTSDKMALKTLEVYEKLIKNT